MVDTKAEQVQEVIAKVLDMNSVDVAIASVETARSLVNDAHQKVKRARHPVTETFGYFDSRKMGAYEAEFEARTKRAFDELDTLLIELRELRKMQGIEVINVIRVE